MHMSPLNCICAAFGRTLSLYSCQHQLSCQNLEGLMDLCSSLLPTHKVRPIGRKKSQCTVRSHSKDFGTEGSGAPEPDPFRLQERRVAAFQGTCHCCHNAHAGPSEFPSVLAIIIAFIEIKMFGFTGFNLGEKDLYASEEYPL